MLNLISQDWINAFAFRFNHILSLSLPLSHIPHIQFMRKVQANAIQHTFGVITSLIIRHLLNACVCVLLLMLPAIAGRLCEKCIKCTQDNRIHLSKNSLKMLLHTHCWRTTVHASCIKPRTHNNNRTNCITHYFWLFLLCSIHDYIYCAFIVLPQLVYFRLEALTHTHTLTWAKIRT